MTDQKEKVVIVLAVLGKLKLIQLSKSDLETRELNILRGGADCDIGSCSYTGGCDACMSESASYEYYHSNYTADFQAIVQIGNDHSQRGLNQYSPYC